MIAYVGVGRSTANSKMLRECRKYGIREICQPREKPTGLTRFAQDNGAWLAYKHEAPFDDEAFRACLDRCVPETTDFVVAPDVVAGGEESLDLSMGWIEEIVARTPVPIYVAVQDGMRLGRVAMALAAESRVGGLFVGGTNEWKVANVARIAVVARDAGVKLHVGRAGTVSKVRLSRQVGADSLDSSMPLWSRAQLGAFVRELVQGDLFE